MKVGIVILMSDSCGLVVSRVQLFCDPMDCSLPSSPVHCISQARTLEWVAISFYRGSSWHRDQTCISCTALQPISSIAGGWFTAEPPGKAQYQTALTLKQKLAEIKEGHYILTGKSQFWLHPGSVSLNLTFVFCCFCYNYIQWAASGTLPLCLTGKMPLFSSQWDKPISHIFQDKSPFYFSFLLPLFLCSVKETGIQTLTRWLF